MIKGKYSEGDKKSCEIIERCNLVILRFNLVYYVLILLGGFAQYVFTGADLQKIVLLGVAFSALIVSLVSFFKLKERTTYGRLSLFVGCTFFTITNLTFPGSEVMLLLIPFCTLSLLISEREMISLMFTLWIGNAIARVILLIYREGTTILQYKNYLWVVFICFTFAISISMVNKQFGIFYAEEIKDLESAGKTDDLSLQ